MSKIFISYRRGDSQDTTGRIHDRLVAQFGKPNIFKDVDSIPLGVDFRKHLSQVVSQCQIVLAVIGPQWLQAKDAAGQRRLDSPSDFVRIEIEAALARGIPVIPLLVSAAVMPVEADLPPSLAPLSYRNGISVRPDPDFHRDMDRLNGALKDHLQGLPAHEASPGEKPPAASSLETGIQPAVPTSSPPPTDMEPTDAELAAAKVAISQVSSKGASVAFRELHTACAGRVIPALARKLQHPDHDSQREHALKLLAISVRQPEARPYIPLALDLLVDYGILNRSAYVRQAAVDDLMQAACPPLEKWKRLYSTLGLADEKILGKIIGNLRQVTPPAERQRTGAALTEILARTSEQDAVNAASYGIQVLNYRAAVPPLIGALELALPHKACAIAKVLVSWHVIEAAPALRQAIDNARYVAGLDLATLMTYLYTLEGAVCAPFLAEVLRDAMPATQQNILHYGLTSANEEVILAAVAELQQSADDNVKQAAQSFLQKRGRK